MQSVIPIKYGFWHVPLTYVKSDKADFLKKYDFFAVVRDPYQRAISEYHYTTKNVKIDKTRDFFNDHIVKNIELNRKYNHWAPQYLFIYDNKEEQIVKHIIHFENLKEEFDALMKLYNIDVQLTQHINKSDLVYGLNDLYPSTVKLINDYYDLDFKYFGYSKILSNDIK